MLVIPKCAILITAKGGPTCHAAIVSRQLGVPAIVGIGNTAGVSMSGSWENRICHLSYHDVNFDETRLEGSLVDTVVHWKKNGSVFFERKGPNEDLSEHGES